MDKGVKMGKIKDFIDGHMSGIALIIVIVIIVLKILLLIGLVYTIYFMLNYISEIGLKSIFESIWGGTQQNETIK